MLNAIGIVEPLQRRLAARAEPAAIDRRVGIPLELHRPPLANAHTHAAAGRAFAARGGVVRRGTRYLVFGLHQIRDQPLGGLGADAARCHGGCTGAGDAEDLQEASAIDRVSHISNGTRYSRESRRAARDSGRTSPCGASRLVRSAASSARRHGRSRTIRCRGA